MLDDVLYGQKQFWICQVSVISLGELEAV